jgi:hypothetical protein
VIDRMSFVWRGMLSEAVIETVGCDMIVFFACIITHLIRVFML